MSRELVLAIARDWEARRVRWRHQGDSRAGADCLGFMAGVLYEAGVVDARTMFRDPKFRGYGRDPNPAMLEEALATYCDRVSIRDLRPCDVLQLKWPLAIYPHHFAFVTEIDRLPTKMIHCTTGAPRRVVEQRIDRTMLERLRGVWRVKELA